jgi:hypothetical protein
MAYLPPGIDPNLLLDFASDIEDWMDGAEIPELGPHHAKPTPQFACTINKDFAVEATGAVFAKGMQGRLIKEAKSIDGRKANIFVEGVTEYWVDGKCVKELWVPAENVDKGAALDDKAGDMGDQDKDGKVG